MKSVRWNLAIGVLALGFAAFVATTAAQARGGAAPAPAQGAAPSQQGAAPDSYVVQLTIYGGDIKWGAPVTDAEDLKK